MDFDKVNTAVKGSSAKWAEEGFQSFFNEDKSSNVPEHETCFSRFFNFCLKTNAQDNGGQKLYRTNFGQQFISNFGLAWNLAIVWFFLTF